MRAVGRLFERRNLIPFEMFDLPKAAEQAKRAHRLESIYHHGQELAWDGRDVLQELLTKHQGIHINDKKREALRRIFAIILWGELAAWKISAQLADELVPLEAKMAATSQAHDEARHFYVMYDYLRELGEVPRAVTRPTYKVLNLILNSKPVLHKLTGMQLIVEPLALTIFQLVRRAEVEPVLSELLRFYERDEARHVGLGVQFLPELISKATKLEAMRSVVFQLRVIGWTLRGLRELETEFEVLGISARDVIMTARNKLFTAYELLWTGVHDVPIARSYLETGLDSMCEILFPRAEVGSALFSRLNAARKVWRDGGLGQDTVDLAEE